MMIRNRPRKQNVDYNTSKKREIVNLLHQETHLVFKLSEIVEFVDHDEVVNLFPGIWTYLEYFSNFNGSIIRIFKTSDAGDSNSSRYWISIEFEGHGSLFETKLFKISDFVHLCIASRTHISGVKNLALIINEKVFDTILY